MLVWVREKSFNDKKDKNKIVNYNEFYITFECFINEEYEKVDIVLKIEDKLAKQMLLENLSSADFTIRTNTGANGRRYHNPVVTFNVGINKYTVDVKMSAEALILARIGLDGVNE